MVHLLRVVHIVAGAFWVGAVTLLAFVVLPAVMALGPAGGSFMEQVTRVRKLPVILNLVIVLNILSGVALYWRDSGGFSAAWIRTGTGMTFGLGGILGIAVAILGAAVNAPAGIRLGALAGEIRASGGPPTAAQQAEVARLQNRLKNAAVVAAVVLLVATALMAVARYVP
jgi:hypothetical protein